LLLLLQEVLLLAGLLHHLPLVLLQAGCQGLHCCKAKAHQKAQDNYHLDQSDTVTPQLAFQIAVKQTWRHPSPKQDKGTQCSVA
jgi:hypothetical protein